MLFVECYHPDKYAIKVNSNFIFTLCVGSPSEAGRGDVSVQAAMCPPYILPNGTYVVEFSLTNPHGSKDFLPSLTVLIPEMIRSFVGDTNVTNNNIRVTFFYHKNTTDIDLVHCPVFLSGDKKWHIKLELKIGLKEFNLATLELHYTGNCVMIDNHNLLTM